MKADHITGSVDTYLTHIAVRTWPGAIVTYDQDEWGGPVFGQTPTVLRKNYTLYRPGLGCVVLGDVFREAKEALVARAQARYFEEAAAKTNGEHADEMGPKNDDAADRAKAMHYHAGEADLAICGTRSTVEASVTLTPHRPWVDCPNCVQALDYLR